MLYTLIQTRCCDTSGTAIVVAYCALQVNFCITTLMCEYYSQFIQEVTLPDGFECDRCALQLLRQAAEWTARGGYTFWSCSDISIVNSPGKHTYKSTILCMTFFFFFACHRFCFALLFSFTMHALLILIIYIPIHAVFGISTPPQFFKA